MLLVCSCRLFRPRPESGFKAFLFCLFTNVYPLSVYYDLCLFILLVYAYLCVCCKSYRIRQSVNLFGRPIIRHKKFAVLFFPEKLRQCLWLNCVNSCLGYHSQIHHTPYNCLFFRKMPCITLP